MLVTFTALHPLGSLKPSAFFVDSADFVFVGYRVQKVFFKLQVWKFDHRADSSRGVWPSHGGLLQDMQGNER